MKCFATLLLTLFTMTGGLCYAAGQEVPVKKTAADKPAKVVPNKRSPIDWKRLNRDPQKIPPFYLPDPLVLNNGYRVTDAKQWQTVRRPQLLELFAEYEYGHTPGGKPKEFAVEKISESKALDGKAIMRQITLKFSSDPKIPKLHVLMFVPADAKGPVPAFVGLNFKGNHTVCNDPNIVTGMIWDEQFDPAALPRQAKEEERGTQHSRWEPEFLVENGFALLTAYYQDIDVDVNDEFTRGIHLLYNKDSNARRTDSQWGKIGSWAWALSRIMDYIETDKSINAKQVCLIGHSRLGKTALWAGAQDERFAIVISNNSGCGGASLGRHFFGEFPLFLADVRPHWFCEKYHRLAKIVEQIPIDQHELIALIAPRPVYVASATQDSGADPEGEFLSALNADVVYKLLGLPGIGNVTAMPKPDCPVGETIGYHLRTGKHQVTLYDWQQYVRFAKKHFMQ
ncbi:MAG: acetylxylan esterase [Thermoguttaceae bacterium]|nr:acetylxylan esterase [Thermoguttaceae bacterium]